MGLKGIVEENSYLLEKSIIAVYNKINTKWNNPKQTVNPNSRRIKWNLKI
jgi:hypothetical protein